jgi:ankyrin repeat protein
MSNIWDDAGAIRPVLDQTKLAAYLKRDEGFLDAEDLKEGLTPLARALLSGNVKTVTLLLRNKANFDKKVRDGRTPMYLAADAAQGRRRMIQLLLEKNPATFDEEGPSFVQNNTPLMAAVKRDDPEAVKLLVERGASKEKKNSAGKTARDLVDESKPNSANVKKALGFNPSKGLAYQPIIFCGRCHSFLFPSLTYILS